MVGDSPVATGDGGMPDSAAMILTGGRRLGKRKMARRRTAQCALGSASGRCQVDRRVRARRAQRLGGQIESILPYCQSLFLF